jgi:hypothetical protein
MVSLCTNGHTKNLVKGENSMTENGNSMVMPVAPAYGGGGGFGGGFGYGGDWWLILILLFCFGGWGNGFGGWGGGMGGFAADGALLYPWMNQSNQIHDGFRDQMTNTTINGIQNAVTSGFGDVQLGIAGINQNVSQSAASINQNLCQTGNAITSAVANGFAQAEIANNGRQIANMQTAFANQTAMNQGFNGVQSQLAQCCCDNRLATVQTQGIIQNEGNATRFADANNTRDLIENQNRNSQLILDKLCALELDGVKNQLAQAERDNVALQNQLNMANFQASQVAQTADLRQSNATQLNNLVSELRSCPIPSQPVYGSQPIFTCGQTAGCGCGNF